MMSDKLSGYGASLHNAAASSVDGPVDVRIIELADTDMLERVRTGETKEHVSILQRIFGIFQNTEGKNNG
jgi:hypothetical protein